MRAFLATAAGSAVGLVLGAFVYHHIDKRLFTDA